MSNINEKKLNLDFNKENSDKKKGFSFAKIKNNTSFKEKIKSFSKKDLAWLLIGVFILIMAPVSEYFLSKPKSDTALTSGFGERRNIDSNIYEPGINALSAGSPDGMEEVIAPLTARDPASLILGAKKETPPLPPPITLPQETKRDSVADIAKKSFSEATKSSPAPFIPPKMQATLRGASSFFGGGEGSRTSASLQGSKIVAEAKSAPSQAQKKTLVGPQAIPGFKGVASRSDSVNKGAFEKLRTQADKAADFFSGANAKEALESAAAASINPVGSGGFGAVQDGGKTSGFSNNSLRDSRSFSPGDPCRGSLERELYCQEQRKAKEFDLWLKYDLPKSLIQSAVDNILVKGLLQPVGEAVAKEVKSSLNPQPPSPPSSPKYCWKSATQKIQVIVNKVQDGSIQLIPPVGVNDCPCGFLTSEPDPSCKPSNQSSQSGVSNSTSTSSGVSGQNTSGVNFKDDFDKFDFYLKEAVQAGRVGEEANNIFILKENSFRVINGIEQCLATAQNITQNISKNLNVNSFKKLSEYGTKVNEVDEQIRKQKDEYNSFYKDLIDFENRLKKIIVDYESGKIKPQLSEGVVAETLGGQDILPKLKEAIQKVEKIKGDTLKVKEEYLNKFEQRVKSHTAAYSWYTNQLTKTKQITETVYFQTGENTGELKLISSQITTSSNNDVEKIKNLFAVLTGREPKNIVIPNNQSSIQTASLKTEFRLSPSSSEDKISFLIRIRGADKEKIWNSLEVDDRNEKNKENEFFNNVKPSNKFSKGEFPLNFIELPKAENFIVPFVRVKNLEDDIEISKSLIVTSVLDGIEGFKISLGANITQLNSLRNELKPLLDAFSQVQTPASQQPSNNQNNSQTQNNQQPQNNTQPTQPANNQNNSSSNLPPGFNLSWCNDVSYNCKSKLCDVNMYELSRYRVPNYQIFCKDGEKISSCAQRIGISELNLQKACSLSNSSCKKIAENACIKSCINSVSKACQNKKK